MNNVLFSIFPNENFIDFVTWNYAKVKNTQVFF